MYGCLCEREIESFLCDNIFFLADSISICVCMSVQHPQSASVANPFYSGNARVYVCIRSRAEQRKLYVIARCKNVIAANSFPTTTQSARPDVLSPASLSSIFSNVLDVSFLLAQHKSYKTFWLLFVFFTNGAYTTIHHNPQSLPYNIQSYYCIILSLTHKHLAVSIM